ncbi:MAG: tyrosine-type recombinase/integrase [Candidatus Micrarchaeota archaeon]|nr:tyrosine-type recombinase/integrase [Candidatus Micrarchaeota archaeon]
MDSDLEQKIQRKLKGMKADPKISNVNKTYLDKTLRFLYAKPLNGRTILRWLDCLDTFFTVLGKTDAALVTREQMEEVCVKINMMEYKEDTKAKIKSIIKAFYKHFWGEDIYYPKVVAWIKSTVKWSNKMLPEDLLTEAEVKKMIGTARNQRDKAIIALLFDSGIRAGELLNMKVKDVDFNTEPAHIRVDGKTGPRQVPILFSAPYLARYLDQIQDKLSSHDYLWQNIPQSHVVGRLMQTGLAAMLDRIAKEASIDKHVHPHLFRHSRASLYASSLTEQQLKHYFGWAGSSKMAATYVHLSGRDIDNAILGANGMKQEQRVVEPVLKVKNCQRCQLSNTPTSIYCSRCGAPLDVDLAVRKIQEETTVKEAIGNALSDPEVVKKLLPVIQEVLKEKMTKK